MITGMDVLIGSGVFFGSLGLAVATVNVFVRNVKRELYPEPPTVTGIDMAAPGSERTVGAGRYSVELGSVTFVDYDAVLLAERQIQRMRDLLMEQSSLAINPPYVLSPTFNEVIAKQNQAAAMMAQAQANLHGSLYGITNMGGFMGPAGAPVVSNALAAAAQHRLSSVDSNGNLVFPKSDSIPAKDAPTAIVPHFLAKMNGTEVAAFVAQIEAQFASAPPEKKKGLERMLAAGRTRDKEIMDAGRLEYSRSGLEPDNAAIREGVHPAHYHVWKLKKQVEG